MFPTAKHDMAAPRGGEYQQRVWKVSKALDRLALMCEQHHRQTKHVDGLPDWTTPAMPAGVKTHDHIDVPANFAWELSPPKKTKLFVETRGDPYVSTPSQSVLETHYVPAEKVFHEQTFDVRAEDYQLEKQSEALRASTRNMLSRLSMSSIDSLDITGGQSTRETVRPISMPRHSPVTKPDVPVSTHAPVVETRGQQSHAGDKKESRPTVFTDINENSRGATLRATAPRHALEPHRRRKMHFADNDRSYRGSRGKNFSELTYKEALQALNSRTRRAPSNNNHAALTTYQQTYQWPKREHIETMMDKVGGQTAGGPTRYEPRRVFTAEDAIQVAKESAVEFQPGRATINHSAQQNGDRLDELKGAAIPSFDSRLVNDDAAVQASKPRHTQSVTNHSAGNDTMSTPLLLANKDEQLIDDSRRTQFARNNTNTRIVESQAKDYSTKTVGGSALNGVDNGEHQVELVPTAFTPSVQAQDPLHQTRELKVSSKAIEVVEASTQTDLPKVKKSEAVGPSVPVQHVGYCSHCGRSGEPASAKDQTNRTFARQNDPATGLGSGPSKNHRSTRAAPSGHRPNPIFTNARYPAEPSIFRGKTTYASEYGTKRSYKR